MIKTIKQKLAEYLLSREIKNVPRLELNFRRFIETSQNYLAILPENHEDFQTAFLLVEYLKNQNKKLTLFCPEFKLNLIQKRTGLEIITYELKDVSKLDLPKSGLKTKLKSMQFDVVINLSRQNRLFFNAAASLVNSKFRIGFRSENSDKYYNFQLSSQINSEISYRNLLNSFKMF